MSKFILIVDDNPSDLLLSSSYIEKAGFIPVPAKDGFSALEQIDEYDFQMMIVNLEMPKMNGIELIKKVRNLEQFKFTPIMVIGQELESESFNQAVQAGANDFLSKPLNSHLFEEKFYNWVGTTEPLQEYSLGFDQEVCGGYYKKMLIVQSLSEVGATALVEELWPAGRIFEIGLNILLPYGIPKLLAQVSSSKAIDNKFILKLTFVDLSEDVKIKLRQVCRELRKLNP